MRPLYADMLIEQLRCLSKLSFKNERNRKLKKIGFVRMSPNRFDHLLELIKSMIMKKNAVRAPIPPDKRNSLIINYFHHLLRTLVGFTKILSKS